MSLIHQFIPFLRKLITDKARVLPSKWLPSFRSLDSDMGVALAFDLR
jgi:hypothetical protein